MGSSYIRIKVLYTYLFFLAASVHGGQTVFTHGLTPMSRYTLLGKYALMGRYISFYIHLFQGAELEMFG